MDAADRTEVRDGLWTRDYFITDIRIGSIVGLLLSMPEVCLTVTSDSGRVKKPLSFALFRR